MSDPLTLSVIILGVISIASIVLSIVLFLKIKTLTRGKNGSSLEEVIGHTLDKVNLIESTMVNVAETLTKHDTRLGGSIRGMGLVRFNPFQGTGLGGNQSFALSLLDEKGDGVILSSLYARDRMSMFAKPVKALQCEFELTEEELSALDTASKGIR